jgi:hypothetical protein
LQAQHCECRCKKWSTTSTTLQRRMRITQRISKKTSTM